MNVGVAILGFFGALWCAWGVWFSFSALNAWFALPAGVMLLFLGASFVSHRGGADMQFRKRVGVLFGAASAIEGFLIGFAFWALGTTGQYDLAPHTVALIVGLHFIPVAWLAPMPRYFIIAGAMVLLVAVAGGLPMSLQPVVICFGSAVILWVAAVTLMTFPIKRGASTE